MTKAPNTKPRVYPRVSLKACGGLHPKRKTCKFEVIDEGPHKGRIVTCKQGRITKAGHKPASVRKGTLVVARVALAKNGDPYVDVIHSLTQPSKDTGKPPAAKKSERQRGKGASGVSQPAPARTPVVTGERRKPTEYVQVSPGDTVSGRFLRIDWAKAGAMEIVMVTKLDQSHTRIEAHHSVIELVVPAGFIERDQALQEMIEAGEIIIAHVVRGRKGRPVGRILAKDNRPEFEDQRDVIDLATRRIQGQG